MFPLEPATASGYFETAGTEYGRTTSELSLTAVGCWSVGGCFDCFGRVCFGRVFFGIAHLLALRRDRFCGVQLGRPA